MQKTAQRRGILNRLREMSNVSGIAAEKFFNPQFQEIMETLRVVDGNIRSIVAGKQLDGGDPGTDPIALKDLLKSAKSNINKREYMSAVVDLGKFHKKFADIVKQIGNLKTNIDNVHHQYLFKDDEHKKELEDLKNRWAVAQKDILIKEASIADFFYNIGNARGRALGFYEKRFPKQVKQLKKDTITLLDKSEGLFVQLISDLKEMASARAVRNVDKYSTVTAKVVDKYKAYDDFFKKYYTDHIKNFFDKIAPPAPTQKVEENGLGNTEIKTKEAPELNVPPTPKEDEYQEVTEKDLISTQPTSKTPVPPPLPTKTISKIPPAPDTLRELTPPPGMESSHPTIIPNQRGPILSHNNFMESLESLSQEDPIILSSYIKKYAQSIQNQDPTVAIQLFQIAKFIKG